MSAAIAAAMATSCTAPMTAPMNASTRPSITARRWLTPAIAALSMAICLLAANSPALACGGGGSGSYRKPPRPGHQHQSAASNPQREDNRATRD